MSNLRSMSDIPRSLRVARWLASRLHLLTGYSSPITTRHALSVSVPRKRPGVRCAL